MLKLCSGLQSKSSAFIAIDHSVCVNALQWMARAWLILCAHALEEVGVPQ